MVFFPNFTSNLIGRATRFANCSSRSSSNTIFIAAAAANRGAFSRLASRRCLGSAAAASIPRAASAAAPMDIKDYLAKDFPANLAAFKIIPDRSRSQIQLIQQKHPDFDDITICATLQDAYDDSDDYNDHGDDGDLEALGSDSDRPERATLDNDLENPMKDEHIDNEDAFGYDAADSSIVHMRIKFKYRGYNLLVECQGPASNCQEASQFKSVDSQKTSQSSRSGANNYSLDNNYFYGGDGDEMSDKMPGRDYFAPTGLIISADEIGNVDFDDESIAVLYMEELNDKQQTKVNDLIERIGLYSFSEEITNILIKHKENLLMNQLEILSKF